MLNRLFIKRAVAYIIDIVAISVLAAILTIVLNKTTDHNFIAPHIFKFAKCDKAKIISDERMQSLFPLSEGQFHKQTFCKITTMGITSYDSLRLMRVHKTDNSTHTVSINYPSNDRGEYKPIYTIDTLLWLFAPLLFAFMISKKGYSVGKMVMGLVIYTRSLEKPSFASAVKREYLKFLPLVIGALFGVYEMSYMATFDVDITAEQVLTISETLTSNFIIWTIGGFLITIAVFWYQFGSFIRWNGQAYWDRWTGLFVNTQVGLLHLSHVQETRANKQD